MQGYANEEGTIKMCTNYSGNLMERKVGGDFSQRNLVSAFFLKEVKIKTSITNESLVFQAFCLLLWNDFEGRN